VLRELAARRRFGRLLRPKQRCEHHAALLVIVGAGSVLPRLAAADRSADAGGPVAPLEHVSGADDHPGGAVRSLARVLGVADRGEPSAGLLPLGYETVGVRVWWSVGVD